MSKIHLRAVLIYQSVQDIVVRFDGLYKISNGFSPPIVGLEPFFLPKS